MAEWKQDTSGIWWYVLPSGVRRRGEVRVCEWCGKEFPFHKMGKNKGLYCSIDHANKATKPMRGRRGSDSPNYKGGHVDKNGYRMIYTTRADGSRKLVGESRVVMEQMIGRELRPEETVHHRNGDKLDNAPENLELWSSRHPKGQRVEDLLEFAREIAAIYG